MTTEKSIKSRTKGVVQLLSTGVAVWAMTFFVLPAVTNSCSSFKTLADFIDSSGIDTGQFYYTDVEIVTKADIGARSTIEFFSDKKKNQPGTQ